jgi:hypothetical protein
VGRKFSILIGIILIASGAAALALNLGVPLFGQEVWRWAGWQLWPLLVVGTGLLLFLMPFLVRGKRTYAICFIFSLPVIATGGILLFTSLFRAWTAWEVVWPLEVLSLALGFLFAAIYARNIWLMIPAIIIGANGLVFQFCALTGRWESWAVVWLVEPLSVGLALLLVSATKRLWGVFLAGSILCALAGVGLTGMSSILSGWWPVSLVGPALLILAGIFLLVGGIIRPPRLAPQPAAQRNPANASAPEVAP